MKRTMGWCVALAAVGLACSLAVWGRVPDPMPIHWGFGGQPDNYASRTFGLLLMPGIGLAMGLLFPLLLRCEPRREHIARSLAALRPFPVMFSGFFLAMHLLMLRAVLREDLRLDSGAVVVLLGLLWMGLGNLLPKLRSNTMAGIRTPWTLRDEGVWHRTHRFAGWCFVLGGLVNVVAGLTLADPLLAWVGLPAMLGSALLPTVYSYFDFRRVAEEG